MFKQLSTSLLIASACILSSCTPTVKQEIAILPTPVSLTEQSGAFVLKDGMKIGVSDQSLFPAAGYLQDILRNVVSTSVEVTEADKADIYLQLGQDNGKPGSYKLQATPKSVQVEAGDYSGIVSAIASLHQLLPAGIEVQGTKQTFSIPAVQIEDSPRFEWRGFMLDASRHFWNKDEVKHVLDLMSLYKLNKFHWHLTDDQGWRIEIKKYPKLIEVGSKRKCSGLGWEWENDQFDNIPQSGHYTQEDIKEIVAYAKKLNITIVPEIEILTHSSAAIASYPQLGTTKKQIEVECRMGVFSEIIDVSDDFAIQFMHDVLDEVMALFPGEYIHIGGDEAHGNHWANSQSIRSLKNSLGITENFELQIWYFNQINKYLNEKGRKMMGWSDMAGPVGVASKMAVDMPGAISQYWAGSVDVLNHSLRLGFKVVQSHTDFAYFNAGLQNAYLTSCIPERVDATKVKNIIGFEASCWSEWDSTLEKTFDHIFPRIAAYAETAWSKQSAKDYTNFKYRLSPMWDLWKARGIYVGGMDEKNYPGPGW